MKKRIYLLVFLIIITSAFAQNPEDILFTKKEFIIDSTISSDININYLSPDAQIVSLSSYVTFFPKDSFRQDVIDIQKSPEPRTQTEKQLTFTWNEPNQGTLNFNIHSTIKTENTIIPVKEKIPFPLTDLPQELHQYLQEQENIDITPQMRRQANDIAVGNDDLYLVVHDIADWVETNIEYDLNTVTAEAALPASWVFENRHGVCDELTLLFIAMLRSIGIPARFASGVSYTASLLFDEKWNAHAWAEVYFPDAGWVPFDVTYQQFGHIDPSHIKFRDAKDGNSSLTHYTWQGYDLGNIQVQLNTLDFDTKITHSSQAYTHPIQINSKLFAKHMGFDSYNRLDVTLNNPTDAYYSVPVNIFSSEELVFDNSKSNVAIPPRSQITESFLFKTQKNLDKNLHYNIPVHVATQWQDPQIVFVESDRTQPIFQKSALQTTQTTKTTIKQNATISCQSAQQVALNQEFEITCQIQNTGTTPINSGVICFNEECITAPTGIGQTLEKSVTVSKDSAGNHAYNIVYKGRAPLAITTIVTQVLKRPTITIKDIKAPEIISYGTDFNIAFNAQVAGTAKDVHIMITNGNSPIAWTLEELEADQPVQAEMTTSYLKPGSSPIDIVVTYHDIKGNKYETKETIHITLINTNIFQRMWLSILHFFNKF